MKAGLTAAQYTGNTNRYTEKILENLWNARCQKYLLCSPKSAYFLDPRRQCTFLPVENVSHIDQLRLTTYESFASSVKAALSGSGRPLLTQEQKDHMCLESSTVSERIFKTLGSNV